MMPCEDRGGRFLAVGRNASVSTFVSPQTKVIELRGKTLVPGLMDTHTRFRAAGEALVRVNLKDTKTVAEDRTPLLLRYALPRS